MLLVLGLMALERSSIPVQNNGAFFICNFVSWMDGFDVVRQIYPIKVHILINDASTSLSRDWFIVVYVHLTSVVSTARSICKSDYYVRRCIVQPR
jgi:hypothetical protein